MEGDGTTDPSADAPVFTNTDDQWEDAGYVDRFTHGGQNEWFATYNDAVGDAIGSGIASFSITKRTFRDDVDPLAPSNDEGVTDPVEMKVGQGYPMEHVTDGGECWCDTVHETVPPATPTGDATLPAQADTSGGAPPEAQTIPDDFDAFSGDIMGRANPETRDLLAGETVTPGQEGRPPIGAVTPDSAPVPDPVPDNDVPKDVHGNDQVGTDPAIAANDVQPQPAPAEQPEPRHDG